MKPERLTDAEIQSTLTDAVKDAVSFIESEIAEERITAQKYFDGGTVLTVEEGRSKVVATKCRDTIRAIKPLLMRLFLQSDKPVEFVPRSSKAVQGAEQATAYAKYIFERNDGFRVIHDAFHDALVKKTGVVKVYYNEEPEIEIDNYTDLSDDQYALVVSDPEVEVLEHEAETEAMEIVGPDGMPIQIEVSRHDLKVARKSESGEIRFDSVAPEDFFVDRNARNIDDCYVCGHSTIGRVGDLVAMGFDFEEVWELGSGDAGLTGEAERIARNDQSTSQDTENPTDPSMRKVLITEAYMKMDIEGTGIARLYKFICGGQDYKILGEPELCDMNPFAVFEVDPEPHTFFGRSLVDIITNDQDAATSMLRGLLDGIQMSLNPRMEAVDGNVNMDDLLNGEIGGVIRTKSPGMLREISIGNGASTALPAMQYFDEVVRGKTGVVGAGQGLNADALQADTVAAVTMLDQANSAVAELIARHLAEGGMRQLFRIIVSLARQHPNPEDMMRIEGQFVQVDPRSWSTAMDVIANVGLGTGKHEEKLMTLNGILKFQMGVFQAFGPTNGLVTITNIRNTQADIAKLGGIYNVDRYLQPMNPQIEQQLMQQKAQEAAQQGQASDPNAAFLQAEQMKTSARVQADQQKAQLDYMKAQMDDDRQRDKMLQDLYLKQAELQQKGQTALNAEMIRAQQRATQPVTPQG